MSQPAQESPQLGLLDAIATPQDWPVRTSTRARRLSVRVLPGGRVDIVVPRGTRPATVERFVARHRGWIERKVEEFRALGASGSDALPAGIGLRAIGFELPVEYVEAAGIPRLRRGAESLRISGDLSRSVRIRHLLQRWLLREAHAVLAPWLERESAATGLAFNRVQVRRQRTRWGSCSRRGTISLNACLVFQPPEVVRYLLVHELAHLRHLDHSPAFWRLVGELEPRWRELDRELARGWREVPGWVFS